MKQKFILTPWIDGEPHVSSEHTRRYTHAIAVFGGRNGPNSWGIYSWHTSEKAAKAALTAYVREVCPVHQIVGVSERIGYFQISV